MHLLATVNGMSCEMDLNVEATKTTKMATTTTKTVKGDSDGGGIDVTHLDETNESANMTYMKSM